MKKFFSIVLFLSVIGVNAFGQANTTLSNLTSPTKVNANLVPDKDSKRDLGSSTKAWGILYLDTAVYLGGGRFLSFTNQTSLANTAVGALTLHANTSGYSNTGTGYNVLYNNTTGAQNTAAGYHALFSNTAGTANNAFGISALYSNSTGYWNVALGSNSLFLNTTGNGNIAIGFGSLYNNTTGYSNIAIGIDALYQNKNEPGLVAIGDSALFNNTFGFNNNANGYKSLYSNTSGEANTATGNEALYYNTTGYGNTATGEDALYQNTTGANNEASGGEALMSNTTGYDNAANGFAALWLNTTGHGNTGEGQGALLVNTTGSSNAAEGADALSANTTGSGNTACGVFAGNFVTTGSDNTFVGYLANSGSQGISSNETAIGYAAYSTSGNHVVVGNGSVTSIGGFVNWSNLSDGRVKKNIQENVPGLVFIDKLQPITYNLDLDAADKIIDRPAMKDKDGKVIQPTTEEIQARQAKEQIVYTGFIAQDVEKAAQSLSYDFSGVDKPDNANTLYGLRYSDFVVPLVKAVQELSAKNDSKDSTINSLQLAVGNLQDANQKMQTEIDELKAAISGQQSSMSNQVSGLNDDKSATNNSQSEILYQNAPNPFSQNTTIQFYIPSSASNAMIVVTDLSGKTIQQFNHLAAGNGAITIQPGTLSASTYQYSLIIDGKIIDTKQMILTK